MYEFKVTVDSKEDAEFLVSFVKGVAATNHVVLHEAVEVRELFVPVRLFTDEQRAKVMEKVDLHEYANASICGDGLEIDRAKQDFEEMADVDVVRNGPMQQRFVDVGDDGWEDVVREELAALPVEVVDATIEELRKET